MNNRDKILKQLDEIIETRYDDIEDNTTDSCPIALLTGQDIRDGESASLALGNNNYKFWMGYILGFDGEYDSRDIKKELIFQIETLFNKGVWEGNEDRDRWWELRYESE